MHIKPNNAFLRNPYTRQLVPECGIEVPHNDMFWHRLINDGDVVLFTPNQSKAPAAPDTKETK